MPDWVAAFNDLYTHRTTRSVTFRKAVLSGGAVTYPSDAILPAGIRYIQVGFDPFRGVYYAESRVETIVWLRDWFGRATDGATPTELSQMIADARGDIREGSREHFSRFLVDGDTLKYDRHAYDQRPDGVIFAVILVLQAAG